MKYIDIYQFFNHPPPTYITREEAVCYIVFALLKKDCYGSELIKLLEYNYQRHRLSDTVLYGAIKFLEKEKIIISYWQKAGGRGRPRHLYQLHVSKHEKARELAELWRSHLTESIDFDVNLVATNLLEDKA